MEKIGVISYVSLEDLVEYEYEVLAVIKDKNLFQFEEIFNTDWNIVPEITHLVKTMYTAKHHLYKLYQPLFPNFSEILTTLLGQEITFASPNYFDSIWNHNCKKNHIIGVYVDASYETNNFGIIEKGSHIRNSANWGISPLKVLYHELGHALHHYSCELGITDLMYQNSDSVMKEVMAITAARTEYQRKYKSYPHKKALRIIKNLERHGSYGRLSFPDKWKLLLQFGDHKDFKKEIPALRRAKFKITSS